MAGDMQPARIAIIGDYSAGYISHSQTGEAIDAAAGRSGADIAYEWVGTEMVASDVSILDAYDAYWIAPGGPYRSLNGALAGIKHARGSRRPLLGT
jgi:CTP synthase (UTP-ammonia lyase)